MATLLMLDISMSPIASDTFVVEAPAPNNFPIK